MIVDVEVAKQSVREQAQQLPPELEIDVALVGLSTVYRLWQGSRLLGVFYEDQDGKWVAQPDSTDCHCLCDTEFQAQLVILAIKGLLVIKRAA